MGHRVVLFFFVFPILILAGCGGTTPPIAVMVSPSSPQTIEAGQTVEITAFVANDRSNKGVMWSLTGPGSLTSANGLYTVYHTPATSPTSVQQVVITATSAADKTKSASVQVTVNPYLQIPFQTLPTGTVGNPYKQSIALTGGVAPFQWSIYNGSVITGWKVGGSLSDGLTIDPDTGTISGTPSGGGTWFFEATVTDATGVTSFNGFLSIQINPGTSMGHPVPFLNQPLVPTAVSPGSTDFTLSVSGTGFIPGAAIDLDNQPLTTTFVDSEHLSASVPAKDVAAAKTAQVTVVNPSPGGGPSNAVYLQVGAPESTVVFANAPNSPLQISEPSAVVVGDFNEDGRPDLAIAASVYMYVLLGKGDGTFAPAAGSPFMMPSPPYDDLSSPHTGPALATGDFNHSGHLGLAVGLAANESATIAFGNGDGTFTFADTPAWIHSDGLGSLSAADFNQDGNLDLVAVNALNGESPVTLLGYGHGAFNSIVPQLPAYGISSAAGDFNSDGKLDLVIDGESILLGNGDGTFAQGSSADPNGAYVAAGDFNGDGKLDLAVTDELENTVTIFLGDGNGGFAIAPTSPIPVGNKPWGIIAGDFNDDGKLDLAVANYGDNTVTLLLGNGDGTFTPASGSPYEVGSGPSAIAAADFNGDGRLDLVVTNSTDGTVSILLQQ